MAVSFFFFKSCLVLAIGKTTVGGKNCQVIPPFKENTTYAEEQSADSKRKIKVGTLASCLPRSP